jgi:hypothetical protein
MTAVCMRSRSHLTPVGRRVDLVVDLRLHEHNHGRLIGPRYVLEQPGPVRDEAAERVDQLAWIFDLIGIAGDLLDRGKILFGEFLYRGLQPGLGSTIATPFSGAPAVALQAGLLASAALIVPIHRQRPLQPRQHHA